MSLLFDPSTRYWDPALSISSVNLPTRASLEEAIVKFKESLHLTNEQIELATREQRLSSTWFSARQYHLTASIFGEILHHRPDTPPDNTVKRILHPKSFYSVQTEWGITQEPVAIQEYIRYQQSAGYYDLVVHPSGFIVSEDYSYLGASPDGVITCPSLPEQHGYLEVKCPYSQHNVTPIEACATTGFCCELDDNDQTEIKLRKTHKYYAQVQGHMAIGKRQWCDFNIYTKKGIAVERIPFDEDYWKNNLLPHL